MSWLGSLLGFESNNANYVWDLFKQNPERAFLGAADPLSSKLWGSILGKDYEPAIDQFGNPTSAEYANAQSKGIDTGPAKTGHDIATAITLSEFGGSALGSSGSSSGGGMGDWLNSFGDMFSNDGWSMGGSGSGGTNWTSILGNLGNLYSGISGNNQANSLQGLVNQAYAFQPSRAVYSGMLNQLMADPSMVTQLPGYQFGMDQVSNAVNKSMAAQGMSGSGTAAATLANSAQQYAGTEFNTYLQQLMNLAGVNFDPANMIKATQSNQQTSQNSTGSMIGSIGGLLGSVGSLFGGMFGA